MLSLLIYFFSPPPVSRSPIQEEAIMISEVLSTGGVLGPTARDAWAKEVVITKSNYSASKRPEGQSPDSMRRVELFLLLYIMFN